MPDDLPDIGRGIYLTTPTYQRLQGDLFQQAAHGIVADAWRQQVTASLPDMLDQAQQAEAVRQAAEQHANDSAQRDANVAQFQQSAAPVLASLAPSPPAPGAGYDPSSMQAPTSSDSLTNPLAAAPTAPAPPDSAPQPAPATDAAPDPTSLPVTPTAPLVAPDLMQQPPAPVAPAPAPTPTAPQSPITPPVAATPTTAGISGGGDLSGRVGQAGMAIMSAAGDAASWLGDQGAKAVQAVLLTEGGLAGAKGDQGRSRGPLQFLGGGGQLDNFAAQHNLTLAQAGDYVEQHPEAAISWAIGTPDQPGYLGAAILAGQKAGLQGPDLATYAQQHGQVSVSPERAGANWNALFGNGSDPISGIANGAMRVLNSVVQNVAGTSRPSQFGLGLSDSEAYAACGPAAAMAFARATGQNPTADQAMALAKSVGWSAAQGMAGPSSEIDLLTKMGVPSHLEAGADPNKIAQDVQNGNPVMISTPGHYFVVDGVRQNQDGTQSFHTGTSGTDLKAGSDWMSLEQMQAVMGKAQGTLYMDRKPGDGPSVAVQQGAADTAQAPASSTDQQTAGTGSSWLNPLKGIGDAVGGAASAVGNAVGSGAAAVGGAVQSGLSGLQGIFGGTPGASAAPASSNAPTAPRDQYGNPISLDVSNVPRGSQPTPSDTLTNPSQANPYGTPAVTPTGAQVPQPTVFDAAGQAIGAGASALGTATTPFRGASDQFPTGGPAAGPGVGMERQLAGFDQLRATNPQYAALATQRDQLLAQQPANAAAAGGPDVIARAQQIRDVEGQMLQIAHGSDIPALAQQNPDIASYEARGGMLQAAAAAPLVAGDAPLAMRALASVIDPQTGLPSVAGRAIEAARGAEGVVAGAGHLTTPVDSAVASAADTPLSLTPAVLGGAQPAAASVRLAATLGGAAAGGGATYAATDPSDPNRILKIAGGTLAGGAAAYGAGGLLSAAPLATDAADAASQARGAVADVASGPLSLTPLTTAAATDAEVVGPKAAELANNINLAKYPEEVRQVIEAAAPSIPDAARRGVMPDALVSDLAQSSGIDIGKIVENWQPGQAQNAETLLALRNGLASQGQKVLDAQQALVSNPGSADAQAGLITALTTHRAIQEVVEGGTAEAGRALRQFTQPVDGTVAALQQLQKMAIASGETPAAFATRIAGLDLSDPSILAATAKALSPGANPSNAWNALRALRVGSLAGGIPTMTHIALNVPLQAAWKMLADVPGAILTGHPETIPMEFYGAWQGLANWAPNAAAKLVAPGPLAEGLGGGTVARIGEAGLLGLVKTHSVIQDAAKQVGSSMELYRQAGAAATDSGLPRFSSAWHDAVNQLVANPTEKMLADIERTGNTFGLSGPMGAQGEKMASYLQDNQIGKFILPFLNIGYHVASEGVERSPLGLLGTGIDVAKGLVGKGVYADGWQGTAAVGPAAERARNGLMGTGLAMAAWNQAGQGNITGNGPDNPTEKADLLKQGWQPDSVRLGGRYFDLHVAGPLGWPLIEAANLYEATHSADEGGYMKPGAGGVEQFTTYAGRMGQYAENETWLRSVGQVLQAMGSSVQSGRMAETEAASIIGSLVPQGGLISNVASMQDPLTRKAQPGDLGQALSLKVPGQGIGPIPGRETVPPKLGVMGEQIPNSQQGLGILLPRSNIAAPDPIVRLFNDAGMNAPPVPKTVAVSSKYSIDITPDEQAQWDTLRGQAIKEIGAELVADPDFATAPVATRQKYLQRVLAQADKQATGQLLEQMPNADLEQRVLDRLGQKVPVAKTGL